MKIYAAVRRPGWSNCGTSVHCACLQKWIFYLRLSLSLSCCLPGGRGCGSNLNAAVASILGRTMQEPAATIARAAHALHKDAAQMRDWVPLHESWVPQQVHASGVHTVLSASKPHPYQFIRVDTCTPH